MADDPEPEAPDTDDPAGSLEIADRVGVAIATRAALDIDGVVETRGAVASLLGGVPAVGAKVGGGYPKAQIELSAARPRLSMEVALVWPCAITQVCTELRTRLADELERLTGVRPVRVDIDVARLVPRSEATGKSGGLVTLGPPVEVPEASVSDASADADADVDAATPDEVVS